jgi:hypothetical protein
MAMKNWSTTAASNATVDSINFAENQLPSTVNNSARALMADVRTFLDDGGWHNWGHTTTYASSTSFTIASNETAIYTAARRIRAVGSSTGTIYGVIASSAYSAPNTTVNITWDSGSLSSETLAVSVSILDVKGLIDASKLLSGTILNARLDQQLQDVAGLAVTNGNFIVGDGSNFVAESGATARTSIGLGTGDSPQFTGVELGAATDTTLSRASAGDVNIEGNIAYRAGGTDVPVTDGGTGSSSASAARTALGLAIGTNVQAYDADLAAIAGLTSASDKLPYFTGSGAAAVADFTSAGRALVDDANAAAQLTTLGAVPKAGGTMTGDLVLAGDPDAALKAATKQYVDNLLVGLAQRSTVRASTTANITIATALNNGDTLDGVTLATDDLVLVKDQSTTHQNGIYKVAASPARDDLFDTYDEHPGALIVIEEGTVNADTIYLCTSNAGGTLNSTAIAFTKVTPAATSLSSLSDVTLTSPATDSHLTYSGSAWIDSALDVSKDTSPQLGGDLDCNGAQIQWSKGADVASATALAVLTDGNYFDVTGTTTVTSINTTGGTGTLIKLHFDGAVTLTHHATNLIIAGAANFTTEAGDEVEFVEYDTGKYRMTGWSLAGTAPGGGGGGAFLGEGASGSSVGNSGDIIRVNQQTLDTSQSMTGTDNGSCTGPFAIASGVTLTLADGATFKVL